MDGDYIEGLFLKQGQEGEIMHGLTRSQFKKSKSKMLRASNKILLDVLVTWRQIVLLTLMTLFIYQSIIKDSVLCFNGAVSFARISSLALTLLLIGIVFQVKSF